MLKEKFLHRKSRFIKKWKVKQNYTKDNFFGEEFPNHLSMRAYHRRATQFHNHCYLDFTPVSRLLDERVNNNWDDIYSELIKKTKPRYRYLLDNYLDWQISEPLFFEHVPYKKRGYYSRPGSGIMLELFFVDEQNILRYYETEEEVLKQANILIRIDKLKKLEELCLEK